MKIAFMIPSLRGGGAERVTANLVNSLASRDFQVTVLTFSPSTIHDYAIDPKVVKVCLTSPHDAPSLGSRVITKLTRLYQIRTFIKHSRPDVVVGMMSHTACQMLIATIGLPPVKIAAERVHPIAHRLPFFWRLARKLLYRLADGVIVQTNDCADAITRICGNVRTFAIPNPVTMPVPSGAGCLPEHVVKPNQKIVLAVGRLVRQKGFDMLVEAFAFVSPAFPQWSLVILGEGTERQNLLAQIGRLHLSDNVHLPGATSAMTSWYSRAELFVLSSRYEGFPNVLLEAMAHGIPAVSFDCLSGPRELIKSPAHGVLVPPQKGAIGLSRELANLMSDNVLRATLGNNAAYVREEFSIDSIQRRWAETFVACRRESNLGTY